MIKYVALLRGINFSGKNIIAMHALKSGFEKLGLTNVITYINSGNVIFSSDIKSKTKLVSDLSLMIKHEFKLDIPIYILTITELAEVVAHAPAWWGTDDKDTYHNTIFILPPTTFNDVFNAIGEPNLQYEKIDHHQNIIYWSFTLKTYAKTNWIKTANSTINQQVTIRTARTVKKLLQLGS